MELSENLLCLFNAEVEARDGSYVIEIPEREIEIGDIEAGGVYRVALVASGERTTKDAAPTKKRRSPSRQNSPPVEEGDVVDVEIEDIGEQEDGVARVGPGYVVIVPDAELGERLSVEITQARENMAFAEIVERYDR